MKVIFLILVDFGLFFNFFLDFFKLFFIHYDLWLWYLLTKEVLFLNIFLNKWIIRY